MIRVLGIGDNVCDKYLHTKMIYPGGNALNIAVFAGFMGCKSAYLGVFGDDLIGQHVYETTQSLGLDTSHCRFERGENGCARVRLVDGDRVFLPGNKGGISRLKPPILSAVDLSYIAGFDLLHTSIYSYMEAELPRLSETGAFVSMDFSNHYTEDYLRQCCPSLDAAEISCGDMEEEKILDTIERIRSYGCRHIVIATRGARGAMVSVDGRLYRQSPCLVSELDTMGAGDSFITAFLVNYLSGIREATDFPPMLEACGITTKEAYTDCLIRLSLYRAAVFSSLQCQRDGSFGYGREIRLTEEDQKFNQ